MFRRARTPVPSAGRGPLLARTALCGALALLPASALALPVGGIPEVSAGGGNPTIVNSVGRTDVALNAPRTVLSWISFDLRPDETVSFSFGARDWIVLNKIIGLSPTKIEGVVEGRVGGAYGGNIWFSSQNSIVFGRGARIDAGGLLAAIGTPDTARFLDPANALFAFSGSDVLPGSRLWVLPNAKVTAHGGMAAFAGPSIVTRANATVTASDGSVLYGSAKSFQIRLAAGAGGDFDLVDFIVPSASDGAAERVAIDLGGDTRANAVFLAAVNTGGLGSAVINLEGFVTATAAKAEGGDIVLSGGGGIANRAPGASLTGAGSIDVYLNKASASRDLLIRNVGRIFARPWVRPPEEIIDPSTLAEDEADPGSACSTLSAGCAPMEPIGPVGVFDPTASSALTAGRDARITTTASLELGGVVTARDLFVSGGKVKGNNLAAAGALSVASTEGDVQLAVLSVVKDGVVSGRTDVAIDTVNAPQRLSVSSGRDITLGDGTSSVAGVISLTAPQNVVVNLASARIDTISAGARADLRGGAIEVANLTAPRLFAQAESLKLDTVTTTGDLYAIATAGDSIVGNATAGDDIYVTATGGTASLANATLTGAGPDTIGVGFVGSPDAEGNGRVVRVESTDLDARLGLGTGGVKGATEVTVRAGRDAVVEVVNETPGTVSVFAAQDATLKAPTVRLETVTAGRDLTVGSTTGDFVLTSNVSAVRNVSISAAGALRVADVRADAGSVSLTGATVTAGAVLASEDLTLKALSGGVTTATSRTGRDLILQGSTLSLGSAIAPVVRDLSITSLGNFTSSSPLSAGRNVTIDVAGKATLGQTSGAGVVRIAAGDLDLTSAVTAPTIQIESRGALQVGGAAGASGFLLDNAEFGQLRASSQVKIYAGLTTGTTRGDLSLQDLTINTAATPNVSFLVGSANTARVTGTAAPSATGGILRIGDATDLSWRPDSILITGALGAATYSGGDYTNIRAFNEVRLAARQDILMGSDRFIGLIQAAPVEGIDLAKLQPAGVAPAGAELLKVYLSTARLEVSAENKVVQQNAAPSGVAQSVGIVFTPGASPTLIIDPPKVVELWGSFVGADGRALRGPAATLTFTIVDASGAPIAKPDGAAYRFGGCDVGATCPAASGVGGPEGGVTAATSDGLLRARDVLSEGAAADLSEAALAAAVSSESLTNPPAILGVAPPSADEIVTDPVTAGTGSEEIWRKRRQKQ